MPNRLRRLLLALALAAVGAGVGTGGAAARLDGPFPVEPRPAPKPTMGQRAVRVALEAVGAPYVWGGASPSSGFDCSGLVRWAYRRLGVELPHSSYALYDRGRRVARTRMEPGDLVFFSGLGHVGMYLGRGRMVHAPSSGRRVEVVPLRGRHHGGRLIGARRITPA
jgi:cell wall-associated NlpC family hydrolase